MFRLWKRILAEENAEDTHDNSHEDVKHRFR